tara:strand:+ start:1215 stop:1520 length:306 start_codon:yes stop_codon:yes gene_type:complete
MNIEDQTVEVKVWDHNDAVIFVYESTHEKTDELHEGVPVWKGYKKVLTAIPVNFSYGSLSKNEQLDKVCRVADALSELYSDDDLNEIGVSYYINHDQSVNG